MKCNSSSSPYNTNCPDSLGCVAGVCPDFIIRRHDTKPDFKLKIEDCDGPLDLTDLVLEASMWAKGKLKASVSENDTYFALADNIGFNQIMVGDTIKMNRLRLPEEMLVIAFDEKNNLVQVQRAYHGTTAQEWAKGDSLVIIKFMNATAVVEMVYEDVLELDGTTTPDVLIESYFKYEWSATDTCLPGCYYLEFKLIKMVEEEILSVQTIPDVSVIPSFIVIKGISVIPVFTSPSLIPSNFGCSGLSEEIEWMRRYPTDQEGFLIKISDSFTSE